MKTFLAFIVLFVVAGLSHAQCVCQQPAVQLQAQVYGQNQFAAVQQFAAQQYAVQPVAIQQLAAVGYSGGVGFRGGRGLRRPGFGLGGIGVGVGAVAPVVVQQPVIVDPFGLGFFGRAFRGGRGSRGLRRAR